MGSRWTRPRKPLARASERSRVACRPCSASRRCPISRACAWSARCTCSRPAARAWMRSRRASAIRKARFCECCCVGVSASASRRSGARPESDCIQKGIALRIRPEAADQAVHEQADLRRQKAPVRIDRDHAELADRVIRENRHQASGLQIVRERETSEHEYAETLRRSRSQYAGVAAAQIATWLHDGALTLLL